MVLVVVVVLAGFEAFKELANFSRTGFQFVSHPPPAGNIQRNFRQSSTDTQSTHFSPPSVLKLNLETNPIFHTFQSCAVLVLSTTKGWLDNSWPAKESTIVQSELHSWCLSESESDFIKLRQTHISDQSLTSWHPRYHQLVKLPLLNFQCSRMILTQWRTSRSSHISSTFSSH